MRCTVCKDVGYVGLHNLEVTGDAVHEAIQQGMGQVGVERCPLCKENKIPPPKEDRPIEGVVHVGWLDIPGHLKKIKAAKERT